jgi:hypothetical protein
MLIHRAPSRVHRLAHPGAASGRLARSLSPRLDDRFHFVADVRAGSREPIDAVVVGPGGTWAITLRAEPGRFRKRNGHWYHWNKVTRSWAPWDAGSITTARLSGRRLERYLERAMLPARVEAALLTPRGVQVDWEADQRPGIHVLRDAESLASAIAADRLLSKPQVDHIIALLDPRQPLPASMRR